MLLSEIARAIPESKLCNGDAQITGLSCDSRNVDAGTAFICLRGLRVDGHTFAGMAVDKGASALIVEEILDGLKVPQLLVKDTRSAMALAAQAFNGFADRKMHGVAITGTKGKTTTAFLIKSIFDAAGYKAGLMGTVQTMIGDKVEAATLTTPDPIEYHALLRRMVDAGCTHYVAEVSAHALHLRKMDGLVFDVGVFTNLTQDHLDYFHTKENYAAAKRHLFTDGLCRIMLYNVDDDWAEFMSESCEGAVSYGIRNPAQVYASDIEITESGMSYVLHWDGKTLPLNLYLSGLFNVYNSMAAASACLKMGISPEDIKKGLESVLNVPGRIENLRTNTPYTVILDYAHSPDSLMNILSTEREFVRNRLLCVFGCGGDRDREKRSIMGEISGKLADFTVITSDNPRFEEPSAIISQIEEGMKRTEGEYVVIENRREAIKYALEAAQPGDIVVLAGKGHETYQEIKGVKYHFDEKEVVQDILSEIRR